MLYFTRRVNIKILQYKKEKDGDGDEGLLHMDVYVAEKNQSKNWILFLYMQ